MAVKPFSTFGNPEGVAPTPAIFLDRDGVINRQRVADYVVTWEQFEFLPGVLDALREASAFGFPLFVITNQQCVGKGLISDEGLSKIHARMIACVNEHGGDIRAVYVCPHIEGDDCDCRKPKPGMLVRAAEEHGLDLAASWFIGDSGRDVVAGHDAGCRTILVGKDRADELAYLEFYGILPTEQAVDLEDAFRRLRAR